MASTFTPRQFTISPMNLSPAGDIGTGIRQGFTGIADVVLKNRDYAAQLEQARANQALAREGLAFRNEQALQEQKNWEKSYGIQQEQLQLAKDKEAFDQLHPTATSPAFWIPDTSPGALPGQLKPAPKGPYDLETIKAATEARSKTPGTRPLGPTAQKLTKDTGDSLHNTTYSLNTWKPEYGGNYAMGELGVNLRAKLFDDATAKDAQNWWSQYRGYVQAIRKNQLYGAALSPGEQESFDAFEVQPTMRPDQIEANLKHQHEITVNAAARVAASLLAGGADPTSVEQQIGMDLRDLGFKLQKDNKTNRILSIDAFPVVPGSEDVGKYGVGGQPDPLDPYKNLGGSQ